MIRIGINGAAGRMGQRLVTLVAADNELQLTAALEEAEHPKIGTDAGEVAGSGKIGIPITAGLQKNVDVLIDFSSPKAADALLDQCVSLKVPLVFATTGITPQQYEQIELSAKRIPILYSPSMSLTVNLAMQLCEQAARVLKGKCTDVEIIEKHHRFKVDAPSGTALKFGKIIADAMYLEKHQHGRHGVVGARKQNEIGYHAVRIGDNPGEHSILFGLLGETLEVTVKATNRDCYASGALTAAKFLYNKPVGLYGMSDVLAEGNN
ncbi:4-hydroxy-tetrahydrodipicolinate reductase [Planctomycetales bacterium]|nr:4-hydroxy-tetrahydrodipicolinate reductase [Planctomycetales bacterium]